MTQKRKHGPRKRSQLTTSWKPRRPIHKKANSPVGLTKLVKSYGRMFIKLFYREKL